MEQFAVKHAGSLAVQHSVLLDCTPAVTDVLKEIRNITIVIVIGYVAVTCIKINSKGTKND